MEAHIIVGFSVADRPNSLDELKRLIQNAIRFQAVDDPFGADGYYFDVTVEVEELIAQMAEPVERLRQIRITPPRHFSRDDV